MAMPWFRLYAEFSSDPKIQMMSEAMQRRLVMLFCLRCSNALETLHETELAFYLRLSDADLAATKELFLAKGFIDDRWQIINWEKRQFASDSSTARVRRHREHKKPTPTQAPPSQETPTKRSRNALEQNRTEQNREKILVPDKRAPDDRHASFREALGVYYLHRNPTATDLPWDGRAAKSLATLLSANPKLTLEDFRRLVQHRGKSEVNHAEPVHLWLHDAMKYAQHPLDRFNQPLTAKPTAEGRRSGDATIGMFDPSAAPDPNVVRVPPEEIARWREEQAAKKAARSVEKVVTH